MLEFLLHVKELSVFNVEQVLILNLLDGECFTTSPHFHFVSFDYGPASFFKALVQVFLGDNESDTWSDGFYLKASISDLSQEFLSKTHFVDNV